MTGLVLETKIQLQNVLAAFSVPVFLGLSAEAGYQAHLCVGTREHVCTRGHVHTLICVYTWTCTC